MLLLFVHSKYTISDKKEDKNMKSVVSYEERGNYGNNRYRGNCSGRLIEDIIDQYKLESLSDYMVGGGTTEDVCRAKGISGTFLDLNRGYDMMTMDIPDRIQNCFWHPPYADIVVYSDKMYSAQAVIDKYGFDPRTNDLSRCKTWEEFVRAMNYCCLKQYSSLEKGGRMFILMGDIKKKGRLYSMLSEIVKPGTLEQIIIKMQHNCVSDRTFYNSTNYVPIIHEYLMVLRKDTALIYQIVLPTHTQMDIRDCRSATWRDVLCSILEEQQNGMRLEDLYRAVGGHKRCEGNSHWKEKIRQTLYIHPNLFTRSLDGFWRIASVA